MHTGEYTFHTNTRQPHLAYRKGGGESLSGWRSRFPTPAARPTPPWATQAPRATSNLTYPPTLHPLHPHPLRSPPLPLPPHAQLPSNPPSHPSLPPSPPPHPPLSTTAAVPRPSTEAQSECFVIIPPCQGASSPSFHRFPLLSDPVSRPTGHSPPLGSSLPPRPRGRYTCDHVHTSNFRFSYPNCFVRVRIHVCLFYARVCISRIRVSVSRTRIRISAYMPNVHAWDRMYGIRGLTEKHAASYTYIRCTPVAWYDHAMRR